MEKNNAEIHIIELNSEKFRLIKDVATGDWLVESPEGNFLPGYFLTKKGAIDWCLEKAGIIIDGDYEFAPDRTSA